VRPIDVTALTRADERGWHLRPLDAIPVPRDRIEEMHVVSVRPDAVRGNHVHDESTEWLLVCGGPAVAAWRAPGQDGVGRMEIPGDAPQLLEIPPGTAHALRNPGGQVLHLVAFSDRAEPGTRPVEPLL